MKKIIKLILTISIILLSTFQVFADDVKDCDLLVTFANANEEDSYIWTIDETVNLNSVGAGNINVEVSSASLVSGHTLSITCGDSISLINGEMTLNASVLFDGLELTEGDDSASGIASIALLNGFNKNSQVVPTGTFTGYLTFVANINSESSGLMELTEKPTDLTGIKWAGNETLTKLPEKHYYINFTCGENIYTSMKYVRDLELCNAYFPSNDGHSVFDGVYGYGGEYGKGWTDEKYKTIQITGGTDVTNSELIDWLWNNGTMYSK